MVCDAMDTAEEVAVCDADDKEATAELAACNAQESAAEEATTEEAEEAEEAAARWASSKEPVTPSKVPLATFAEAKAWQAEPPHVCPCTSPMCHILQRPPHGQSPQPASDATTLRWLGSIMPTTLSHNGYWYKLESC